MNEGLHKTSDSGKANGFVIFNSTADYNATKCMFCTDHYKDCHDTERGLCCVMREQECSDIQWNDIGVQDKPIAEKCELSATNTWHIHRNDADVSAVKLGDQPRPCNAPYCDELLDAVTNNQQVLELVHSAPILSPLLQPDAFENALMDLDTAHSGIVTFSEFKAFLITVVSCSDIQWNDIGVQDKPIAEKCELSATNTWHIHRNDADVSAVKLGDQPRPCNAPYCENCWFGDTPEEDMTLILSST